MFQDSPRPTLLTVDHRDPGSARALQRAHGSGALHRLRRGVYVDADVWSGLDDGGRHRLLARAVARDLRTTAVFSHETAALLLGWPRLGSAPTRVHVVDERAAGTVHRADRTIHGGQKLILPTRRTFAGIPLSSDLDVAVQVATSTSPAAAVVALGHPVRGGALDVERFRAALPARPARGSVRARLVADALDPRHESVGEDLTELRLREIGFVLIVPQCEFTDPADPHASVDRVDFWLPDVGVVVEFDGRQKYVDSAMLRGRSSGDVVWHEKIREDRLRSHQQVNTVIRPRWWHLLETDRLRSLFRQHRVPVPDARRASG